MVSAISSYDLWAGHPQVPSEVIQRQLSHTIGDKIGQAYDSSQMLDERRGFMIAWSDAMLEKKLNYLICN